MKKLNQKGFGAIEVLLLVVVAAIIGGAGYYVYNAQAKTKSTLDDTAKSQGDPQKATKKTTEKTIEKPKETAKKYLVIKELGVKIALSAGNDDAYYVMKNGYAYLSTTSLKEANAECAADKTSVGAMIKVKKTDEGQPSSGGAMPGETYEAAAKKPGSGIVIIGDYAYYVNRSQSYCSEDVNVRTKQQAAWNAFLTQSSTIQAL